MHRHIASYGVQTTNHTNFLAFQFDEIDRPWCCSWWRCWWWWWWYHRILHCIHHEIWNFTFLRNNVYGYTGNVWCRFFLRYTKSVDSLMDFFLVRIILRNNVDFSLFKWKTTHLNTFYRCDSTKMQTLNKIKPRANSSCFDLSSQFETMTFLDFDATSAIYVCVFIHLTTPNVISNWNIYSKYIFLILTNFYFAIDQHKIL